MDVESVLFSGGNEKPGKGVPISVWQAEVALRLSELADVGLHVLS